jgi:hypothetical protein
MEEKLSGLHVGMQPGAYKALRQKEKEYLTARRGLLKLLINQKQCITI